MEFGAFKWGKKGKRGVYLDFEYLLLLCYNEKNLGRKGTGYVLGNDIVEKEKMLDMRKNNNTVSKEYCSGMYVLRYILPSILLLGQILRLHPPHPVLAVFNKIYINAFPSHSFSLLK